MIRGLFVRVLLVLPLVLALHPFELAEAQTSSEQPSPDKTEITKAVKQCVGADGRLAGDSDLRSVLARRVDILRSWERHMEAEQEPLDALRTMMLENRALQISSFR